ncbi:hypothetical protein JYT35_00825 [Acidimicrobium ferrooxidans]|uniref:Uncharacterized protein n=1 Tax=Acidimicrobium ferrooxidans TaxID=53635 RepID=A0ABS3AQN8_9ACTN|nr:hypothetical protein [Acidimicrobium ferrooxidans]
MAEPPLDAPKLLGVDETSAAPDLRVEPALRRSATAIMVLLGGALLVSIVATVFGGNQASTADEGSEIVTDTSVAATTTTAVDQPLVTVAVSSDSSTSSTSSTTTAAPRETVPVGEAFAANPPAGLLAVWQINNPAIYILDLAGGSVTSLNLGEIQVDGISTIRGAGGRLVVESSDGVSWIAPDGTFGVLSQAGEVTALGDDEVWISPSYGSTQQFAPTRYEFAGNLVGLPFLPPGSFPFGYLGDQLVAGGGASGGVYVHAGDRYDQLSDGALIAAANGIVVTRVCDASLDCGLRRTLVETGESTMHVIDPEIDIDGVWWVQSPVSPNGDALLVMSAVLGPVLWDLLTGSQLTVPLLRGRGIAWSSDGEWLFISGSEEIIGIHRGSGDEVRIPAPGDEPWGNLMSLASISSG